MEKFTSIELSRFAGRFYFHDRPLYRLVKEDLIKLIKVQKILQENNDDFLHAYFVKEKGEIINGLLRKGVKQDYPNPPRVEDSNS